MNPIINFCLCAEVLQYQLSLALAVVQRELQQICRFGEFSFLMFPIAATWTTELQLNKLQLVHYS